MKKRIKVEPVVAIIIFFIGLAIGCIVSKPGALKDVSEEIQACPPWDTISRDTVYIKMALPRNYKKGTEIDVHFHSISK